MKVLSHTKFLSLVENNGWVYATRNKLRKLPASNTNAILIAANVDEKLCVIKEFREPIGEYQYALPAGLLEDGETIEECARRELFEECGLNITEILQVTPKLTSSAGMTDEVVRIVICRAEGEISTKNNESSERIEVLTLSPQELNRLMNTDAIFCSKAYLIMCMVVLMAGVE